MAGPFVCASLGIVPTVRHADYICSWLEVLREDDRTVVRAASAASKAADFLLGFLPPAIDSVVGAGRKQHDGSARCARIGPQLVLRVSEGEARRLVCDG
jgi:antirestriction protein ArdC